MFLSRFIGVGKRVYGECTSARAQAHPSMNLESVISNCDICMNLNGNLQKFQHFPTIQASIQTTNSCYCFAIPCHRPKAPNVKDLGLKSTKTC